MQMYARVVSSDRQSKSLCYLTQGEVFGICGFCVVFSVAIPATSALLFVLCDLLPHSRWKFLAEYGRRWTQKRKSWFPGQIRAE